MSIKSKRHTYWSELNAQWESSSLTQRDFCKREGVAYKQFVYWRGRELNKKRKPKKSKQQPLLLQVSTPPLSENASSEVDRPPAMEILIPKGIKLYITTDADVTRASALIQSLGGAL